MSVALDANVLLYAALTGDDQGKRQVAIGLLQRDDCVIPIQALNEMVHQLTRPKRPNRTSLPEALELADALRRFPIVNVDLQVFDRACEVARQTGYRWWDCLIVAAAVSAGCDTLLTEDMRHGRVIDGLRIENPFRDLA